MKHPSVPGHVTKTTAVDRYEVSDRSLGRVIKKAIVQRNTKTLRNLKLVTLDSQRIEGHEVTFKLIDDLQQKGLVPTWLISTSWLQREFGLRSSPSKDEPTKASQEGEPLNPPPVQTDSLAERRDDKIEELYERSIAQLEKANERFEKELKIAHANLSAERKANAKREATHEKHRNELLQIIAGLQKQLPVAASGRTTVESEPSNSKPSEQTVDSDSSVVHAEVVHESQQDVSTGELDNPSKATLHDAKKGTRGARQQAASPRPDSQGSTFVERHLPTLSRPFRRK